MILDDILNTLRSALVCDVTGGPEGYVGYLPNEPDSAVCVIEVLGGEPDADFQFPRFQVLTRGTKFGYEAARTVAENALLALHNATIVGYVYCFATSTVVPVGQDGNERPVFSVSFKLMKTFP